MLRVLIAEDQLLIADDLAEFLTKHNYEVCGIARTVEEGVTLGALYKPDLAVLDVRLAKGGRGPEIAHRLHSRTNFGVLYATGDDVRNSTLTLADGDASIQKPYRGEDIVLALKIVEEVFTKGIATLPFPKGFRLLQNSAPCVPERLPA